MVHLMLSSSFLCTAPLDCRDVSTVHFCDRAKQNTAYIGSLYTERSGICIEVDRVDCNLLRQNREAVCVPLDVGGQIGTNVLEMKHKSICVSFFLVNHEIEFIRITFYRYQA
jgi:hypothetical protein